MKTFIKNVAMLNMLQATPESVAQLAGIGNAAIVVVSPKTKPLLGQISIGNLAMVLEVPEDTRLVSYNGDYELTHVADGGRVALAINGVLTVSPQMQPEDIRASISGGLVNGTVCASTAQMRALTDAGLMVNGKTIVYPDGTKPRSSRNSLTAAEVAAQDMPLCLLRRVLVEKAACEALAAKGLSLYGTNGVYLYETDTEAFGHVWKGEGGIVTIPEGYALMQGDQTFSRLNAPMLKGDRFITGDLYLREDITPQSLAGLARLMVLGKVFVPEAIIGTLLNQLQNEPELIPYAGRLVRVDGTYDILSDDTLEEDIALCVDGVLTIDPAVTPAALRRAIKLAYVDGLVRMTPAQHAALLPVLLGSYHVQTNRQEEEESTEQFDEPVHVLGNAAMYVL